MSDPNAAFPWQLYRTGQGKRFTHPHWCFRDFGSAVAGVNIRFPYPLSVELEHRETGEIYTRDLESRRWTMTRKPGDRAAEPPAMPVPAPADPRTPVRSGAHDVAGAGRLWWRHDD